MTVKEFCWIGRAPTEWLLIYRKNRFGLNNLGTKLSCRYERTGKIENLEEAIRVARQVIEVTPDDHPNLAAGLNNLGNKLESRYKRTGRIEDLEEAIRVARQAVKITPDDHPDLAGRLNNLGSKLGCRYERIGKIEDLEEAIRVTRQAIKITPDDHPDLAGRLNNLGNKLESRYKRTSKIEDLEQAIRVTRQAIEALHVVSGFQVAGFRHVIGCLWPSSDRVCVQVAKSFYSELDQYGRRGHKDRAIALALHKAVKGVCESDEYGKRPLYWAQYVHFGA
ncbi:hypothetical protein GJ744_004955 [Endocarpon pusillum]|uniref:CHAT domain-containing protein n=1 Tax=Endocarpon pusillum TaxID=364733 RepID=A0A8H7E1D6_9EURO|nr:hypothetical protein GJ744_004955 [Endocarpon pusillum]